MKLHKDIIQKSDEWFALRNQYPLTASNGTAIATGGKGLETLVWKATAERLSTGKVERYTNDDMERGNELEPQARQVYELETGNTVEEVGFITNEKVSPVVGVSPDGLIGDDGMLEIKCPADVKYLKLLAQYKSTGTFDIEKGYMVQMQMQMLVAERKYNMYMVYNPNFSPSYLLQRVEVDDKIVDKIKAGLKKGEELLEEINKQLS